MNLANFKDPLGVTRELGRDDTPRAMTLKEVFSIGLLLCHDYPRTKWATAWCVIDDEDVHALREQFGLTMQAAFRSEAVGRGPRRGELITDLDDVHDHSLADDSIVYDADGVTSDEDPAQLSARWRLQGAATDGTLVFILQLGTRGTSRTPGRPVWLQLGQFHVDTGVFAGFRTPAEVDAALAPWLPVARRARLVRLARHIAEECPADILDDFDGVLAEFAHRAASGQLDAAVAQGAVTP